MDVKNYIDKIPDYVLGTLTQDEEMDFMEAVNRFPELKTAVEEWQDIQEGLVNLEESPSQQMDTNFYQFLADQQQEQPSGGETGKVRRLPFLENRFVITIVAASVMLLLGLFIGKQWGGETITNSESGITEVEFQSSKRETEEVRTQLVMSLADEPSAARRLEAISEARKLDTATDKVIQALFKMLNSDPNVNVRIAAVTSLSKYVENPVVREGLVMSIVNQDSPLVQIALADLMVELKEKESIQSIEELLQKPSTNEVVKEKLRESINQIL